MESLMLKVIVTSKNSLMEKRIDPAALLTTLLEASVKISFSSQVASTRINIKWAQILLSTRSDSWQEFRGWPSLQLLL